MEHQHAGITEYRNRLGVSAGPRRAIDHRRRDEPAIRAIARMDARWRSRVALSWGTLITAIAAARSEEVRNPRRRGAVERVPRDGVPIGRVITVTGVIRRGRGRGVRAFV